MKKKVYGVLIFIFFGCIIFLSGCESSDETLEVEKGLSEVRFLENQCMSMFSKYISGDYLLENNQVNWSFVTEDLDVIRNSSDVIEIDFAGLQVPSQNIVDLENNFRQLESFLAEKNLDLLMKKICDIYSLVSNSILETVSKDEVLKIEKKTKSNLLYIGYNLATFNKEEAMLYLNELQANYSELSANKDYIENHSYKINKIFMDIQKLKTAINDENFEESNKILLEIFEFF